MSAIDTIKHMAAQGTLVVMTTPDGLTDCQWIAKNEAGHHIHRQQDASFEIAVQLLYEKSVAAGHMELMTA